ncbi:hypothetical protein R4172_00530 [Rhodococcus kroppenstedtii]|uniref:hypothetical protein n=1 Tax=Rhodococcoides kroppenstedtii TaxID=293050 RepID=UPI002953FFF0|nr:hypothetical protein [Rhodococcus kroppenstedtii]MDV7196043.1 hypothetical protein [Rhodococcus kroppenstedtii]
MTAPSRTAGSTRLVATRPDTAPATTVRTTGALLAVGTVAWAVGMAIAGDHEGFGWQSLLGGATALLFQAGIARLLLLQYRTAAMGEGPLARGVYRLQGVFLAGAVVSTVLDTLWLLHGTPVWMAFDLCWPLSMATMVGIGVRVAIANRWTGSIRWTTLWAQSWFVTSIPVVLIVRDAGLWVASAQLISGYAVLGLLLARHETVRPTR